MENRVEKNAEHEMETIMLGLYSILGVGFRV